MRAMLVRSIPLSAETKDAWKYNDALFARRDRSPQSVLEITPEDVPILNLGNSNFMIHRADERVWNDAPYVNFLLSAWRTSVNLGRLVASVEWQGPGLYWVKFQGRGGANKIRTFIGSEHEFDERSREAQWNDGIVQRNVDGQEYRVITVGSKVVQVSARFGENGARRYEWIGVRCAPTTVKDIARTAVECAFPDYERTVIGWDVMEAYDGSVHIFEGNACPGVNRATASRILDAMTGVSYE